MGSVQVKGKGGTTAAAAFQKETKRVGTEMESRSFFYLRPGAPKESVSFVCSRRVWRRGISRLASGDTLLTLDVRRGRIRVVSVRGGRGTLTFHADAITSIENGEERALLIRRALPRGCFSYCSSAPKEGIVELVFFDAKERAYFTSLVTSCSPSLYTHALLTKDNRLPLQRRALRIFVATWNMGNANAPADLSHLTGDLSKAARAGSPYDLAAFGFQESMRSVVRPWRHASMRRSGCC